MRRKNNSHTYLRLASLTTLALVPVVAISCAQSGGSTFGSSEQSSSSAASGGGGGASSSSASGDGGDIGFGGQTNTGGSGGGGVPCTPLGPDDDVDADGYTPNEGDCNDCDKYRNPNAVEVINDPGAPAFDENCNGVVDEPPDPPCDDTLAIDSMEPLDGVRAVDLCKMSAGFADWGVVSAQWVMADGSPPPAGYEPQFHLGHGLLTGFGPNNSVRRGVRLLALSSGAARQPEDPGYQPVSGYQKGYIGQHPNGFPKESPACPMTTTGEPNDITALEVVVRVPLNAQGFSFDFNFFTYEWPGYICSQYNDFFVALLSPIPAGQTDGNISFDSQGNPVSVNNALLGACGCPENPPSPCTAGNKIFNCPLGNIGLIGTGFGFDTEGTDHAATDWLKTQAPVKPGSEITVRWAVYDSGDGSLDSTSLIDNWQWIAKPGTEVGTQPVPK
jgi:hypothetical protein